MNFNKKRIYLLIMISVVLISIIGAVSYGYFNSDLENKVVGNYVVDLGEDYTFSVYGTDATSVAVSDFAMFGSSYDTVVATETTPLTIELKNDNPTKEIFCAYKYSWRWDLTKDQYTVSNANTLEYTASGPFAETQVPNYNSTIIFGSGFISAAAGETQTKEVNITTKFYNLANVDQGRHADKNYKGGVIVDNVTCINLDSTQPTLASYVTNDVYNSSANQSSITRETKGAGLYKHSTDNIESLPYNAQDDSYRYSGADTSVNNYVCFYGDDCTNENNLYRIISVDSSGITKVIKAASLGNMIWNNKTEYTATGTTEDIAMGLTNGNSYANIWAIKQADGTYYTSSLNDYLNNEYLRVMEAKTNKIIETTWSVAGFTGTERNTKNAQEIYAIETRNKATYPAKVGLIHVYEYMYAALPAHWHKTGYNSTEADGYNSVGSDDWMLTSTNPWIISRCSFGDPYQVFLGGRTEVYGYVSTGNVRHGFGVRPVFNLSLSTKIINSTTEGVGTESNPMIII